MVLVSSLEGGLEQLHDFVEKVPVPQSDLEFFATIPHLKHYVQDQNSEYKPAPFYSVFTKPDDPTADLFFAKTIASDDTIPHRFLLLKKGDWVVPDTPPDADGKRQRPFPAPVTPEVIILYDLKDGMNGFAHTAHGGAMCSLLDETLGMCVEMHRALLFKGQKTLLYTAQLNTSFLAPVQTPGIIRIKAWMLRRDGRKWTLRAQVDDCKGQILMETESLWISTREEGNL